jgi:hypothetical protein
MFGGRAVLVSQPVAICMLDVYCVVRTRVIHNENTHNKNIRCCVLQNGYICIVIYCTLWVPGIVSFISISGSLEDVDSVANRMPCSELLY